MAGGHGRELIFEPERLDGPVLVLTSYPVAATDEEAFVAAMAVMGRSRQRTGAAEWRTFRSIETRVDVRGDVHRPVMVRAYALALHPAHRAKIY